MTLNLGEMTTEEKLKAMEMLWDDICRSAPDFSSPAWHEYVLKEREQSMSADSDDSEQLFRGWRTPVKP